MDHTERRQTERDGMSDRKECDDLENIPKRLSELFNRFPFAILADQYGRQ